MSFKVLGDVSGDIFSNQRMTYILTVCAKCGKEFKRYPGHIYKRRVMVDGVQIMEYFDRYSCWPPSGLLNEKKYDNEKLCKAGREAYLKNKEKYDERNSVYQKAHRAEISARNYAKNHDGTPEAEVRRLERNRKSREKEKQQAVVKWKEEEQK